MNSNARPSAVKQFLPERKLYGLLCNTDLINSRCVVTNSQASRNSCIHCSIKRGIERCFSRQAV
ncbi:hypothetical protein WN51_10718 [Melipona quadrifasciata]|uniref:Uncharacterized protein n=1 Tax=Melipona quadrifasciata TaxID=166423 RepID=A0A0M9ABW9_9HYME|nr:hypothetical protein WN51_10718 [Melipona quadrifasciata]